MELRPYTAHSLSPRSPAAGSLPVLVEAPLHSSLMCSAKMVLKVREASGCFHVAHDAHDHHGRSLHDGHGLHNFLLVHLCKQSEQSEAERTSEALHVPSQASNLPQDRGLQQSAPLRPVLTRLFSWRADIFNSIKPIWTLLNHVGSGSRSGQL